jgi:hypothetical protein
MLRCVLAVNTVDFQITMNQTALSIVPRNGVAVASKN